MQRWWKTSEIKFIKENYGSLGPKEIAKRLDRKIAGVYNMAKKIGASKKQTRKYREWTDGELTFLRKRYQQYHTPYLAEILDRTKMAVLEKANEIGLKKYA